jgi:hypothetical protein
MAHDEARYEYRCFAPAFGLVEARLRAAGGPPSIRESSEIYFVSQFDRRHNVKIRDGQLDIKVLLEVRHGLERWNPLPRRDFPLDDGELARILGPALGSEDQLPSGSGESAGRLAKSLSGEVAGVVVVELFKRRFGFVVDGCIAEYAEVTLGGATIRTACIESVDLEQARRVVAEIGLDAYPNTSYPSALRGITGLDWPPAVRAEPI